MLQAGINREGSFQSAWQSIGETGHSDVLAKARKRLPLVVWKKIYKWIIAKIELEFRWKGYRLIGIDGSCVSMSDEPGLVESFGRSGSKHGKSRFPIARVVFAFMLNTMVTISHEIGSYRSGENALFSRVLKQLGSGDLIVGDRRYAGAKLYVDYMRAGVEFITRIHQKIKLENLKIIKELGKNDFIVRLPISKMYRRRDPSLPVQIQIRIIKVEAKIRGKKERFWLVTSLLDTKRYPAIEIKYLYKKRWKVEGLIEQLKIWLHADILRSKTEIGIYKEIHARIIGFNLIHWLVLKAAKKHNKNPERVSISATLRLTVVYSLKMSAAPARKIAVYYGAFLFGLV